MKPDLSKLLSDKEVLKISGHGTALVEYPALKEMTSIDHLFARANKIILLYVHESDANTVVGHWCCLINRAKSVEFHDSYGLRPDDIIISKSKQDRNNTSQEQNYLSKLLYNSGKKVEYNEMHLQSNDPAVATCGYYSGLRCRYSDIPLKQYQKIFKLIKKLKVDPDNFIVTLGNKFL
jgi:hypothetical protein